MDGRKHPAILWIFGGFGNSIGEIAWLPSPPENDQSASAFRRAGLIMMYPSLRGGNDNPGAVEGFYGEVHDIIAAADYLAKQDCVDPDRIYLGGHSTGGTLALLVAESTDRFRAVFSFGPVCNVAGYGAENLPFNLRDRQEVELRTPALWLHAIPRPTFVNALTEFVRLCLMKTKKR
ncbi:MAG TPA: prolyl oligopeptidase family serine peptidase [Candidatus Sulfotelmatobacter sp.]|nr:prolyl oligopeptidase family serine peptidase [Candidatus Sulfotelmatobacter sp.]